jgi:diphthine synthase
MHENKMGELTLIGMGLQDENGLTLRGLDAARKSDEVYAELYTSIMPGLSIQNLQRLVRKEVRVLSRKDLEENAERAILSKAKQKSVALLTPGDPMSATTHIGLVLSARKQGIQTKLIHSASILTAAAGATGLELYKFGRTVTIPSPTTNPNPESVYGFIEENRRIGLHTLMLLDISDEPLTIPEAIQILLKLEDRVKTEVVTEDTVLVAFARVESPDCIVRTDKARKLREYDYGRPPYSIILQFKLHFIEAEALHSLAGAPE